MNVKQKYAVSKATIKNIPLLVSHHRAMFEEIRVLQQKKISADDYAKMEKAQTEKLKAEIPRGACHAWVAEDNNSTIVASGAFSICSLTASPENPTYLVAYVHSIYTEKQHRGNKLSTRIVNEMISFCREKGISKMFLGASDVGRPIYEALGFKSLNTFMHLTI